MFIVTGSTVTVSTAGNAFGQLLTAARRAATTLVQLVLVSLFALPLLAHAVVAQLGTAASYYGPGPTTGTLANFTVAAGSNRLLVVTASNTAYLNTTAVSFGAAPMTKVVEQNDGLVASDSIWVLPLGSGGAVTANIAATFANQVAPLPPGQEVYLSAVVFSGVDQTTPTSSPVSISTPTGTNLSSTLTVTSAVGDLVYDVFDTFHGTAPSANAGAGQTVVANNAGTITGGSFGGYFNSSKPGAGSVVMSWTSNADAIIQAAINIRQATAAPDLTVTKTVVGSGPFFRSGQVTYRIQVNNVGTVPTSGNWTISDAAPTGISFASISVNVGNTSGCTGSTTAISCTQSTVIPAGGNVVFSILSNIAPNAPASITNTANASGGGEVITNNNAGSVTINPGDPADLTITKTAVGTFQQLGSASYTVTVTNSGAGPTTLPYTVTDTMPSGLIAFSATSPDAGWNCTSSTNFFVSCTRATALAAGASTTLSIPVSIANNAPASITNTASVTGGGEVVTNNNSGSSTVSVAQLAPDLTITKVAQGASFQQGGTVSYLLTVTNGGNGPTTGTVTVQDIMPTGLTATSATGANWTCTTGATVTCTATSAIAAGASSVITLSANIAANAPASITNTAAVATAGESNSGNNSGSSVISVTQVAPDLVLNKIAQGASFQQGGSVTYLITVTNNGNGPTTGTVTMQDIMPTGLTATSATGANWTCTTGATVTCTATSAIAAGASSVITLSANIAANAPASITNTAAVATVGESNSGNNSGSSVISVTATTNVIINVPAGISYTFNGQTVTGTQTFAVAPGTYPLSTTTPQSLGAGVRAVFISWSDAGAIAHSVTVGSSALAITGNFTTQYQLTTAASPANGGTVTPAPGTFFDAGTVVNLTATPNAGFAFNNWTGLVANANAAATTVTMDTSKSVTANFVALQAVTVNVPAGVAFTLNSVNYTGSQTVSLAPGTYTLSTTTPQTLGTGVRAVFNSWSDAGAISHTVTVGSSALAVTGNFTTQYQLTTATSPSIGGSVVPATGTFFDSGTVVNLTATANAGFVFSSWTGVVANGATAATTVTMDAAKSVTANFAALRVFSGPTASGSGIATVVMTTVDGGDNCGFTSAAWVPVSAAQAPPVGLRFPHGLFDFRAGNCVRGSTITLTITYPQPLVSGTTYWKFGPTPSSVSALWYGVTSVISGNTLTFSITDGGLGDDDRTADGIVIDQGGPGVFADPVPTPTLQQWLLALLILTVLGCGLYFANRRRAATPAPRS